MSNESNERDIMDMSSGSESYPAENMPKEDTSRPVVSPQEGGYFLNKFLNSKEEEETSEDTPVAEVSGDAPDTKEELEANIVAALREIYDPEIPVNIYEMGLIYGVDIDDNFNVKVTMTLTTPHCPVAESMPGEVELKVGGVAGVASAEVKLVWEPAWDMGKMSDEARLELGLL